MVQGTVRFTPLLNTNDSFEVRSTFRKLAGPRFLQMLAEQMETMLLEEHLDAKIAEYLQEAGLGWLSPQAARQIVERQYGKQFTDLLRAQLQQLVDLAVPHLNDPKNAEKLLVKLGQELLCFSLSERYDSPPMWAHYGGNHSGFVVAFNTGDDWFQHRKDGKTTRLQKVTYFDGKVEEPFESPQAAFISKTTDWAYEREWRLYANAEQADTITAGPQGPVHLISFPPEAVNHVIVGAKATDETVDQIRMALGRYPSASLYRAVPEPFTQTYKLVTI